MMDAPVEPAPYLPEQIVAPIPVTPIGEGEPAAAPGEERDPIHECDCGDLLCGRPMELCRGFWPAWLSGAAGGWLFEPLNADPPSLLSASDFPFEGWLDLVAIVLSRQADPWSELFEAPASEVLDAPDLVAAVEMRPML
jgi:hypothetical protein